MKHRFKPRFLRDEIAAASGLQSALCQIFPKGPEFPRADLIDEVASGEANHHTILSEFRSAFAEDQADKIQIEALAGLVELSLSVPDRLENAWMTCFFEHRSRNGPLWSQLSPETRSYIKTH